MDDKIDRSGDHIWLRYATQFTAGGRTRTVEMSIPVPLGASQEQREQLLREAEAGMLQLSGHVEKIATQVIQRSQASAATGAPAQNGKSPGNVPPALRPALSVPALQTAEQPAPVREQPQEPAVPRNDVPVVRQPVGASMPFSTGGDVPNNLTIPQFVKIINETLGLDSKQAMSKLGVKSLSGINLRKELERLQQIVQQENNTGGEQAALAVREVKETLMPASQPEASSEAQVRSLPPYLGREPVGEMRNGAAVKPVGFDEEEQEPDESGELLDELDFSHELTGRQRARAHEIIKGLRESGGMTVVSASRTTVLNTLVASQISEQQLLALIQGVWKVNALKKLKVDQAERLISWAKEDDFVNEVGDILKVLEEEG